MREKAHALSRRNFLIGLLSGLSLRRKRTAARASARHLEEKKLTIREAGAQTSEKDFIAQFYDQYYTALERRLEDIFPGDAKAIVDDIKEDGQDHIREQRLDQRFSFRVQPQPDGDDRGHDWDSSARISGGEEVLKIVRHALFEGQQERKAKDYFLAAMAKSPDAFSELVAVSKAKEAGQYGEAFVFERERDDERFYL